MTLTPLRTDDVSTAHRKVLLYGHHGRGKTTQISHYQKHYGKGFIISGESGLSSIRSAAIDYLPFTSWSGATDPDEGNYSFIDIFKWIRSPEFKKKKYQWIGIDSLSELSDHSFRAATEEAIAVADKAGKKNPDGFAIWANHTSQMLGACKAIRDLPMHVIVTALAKETKDENDAIDYWPMVGGKQLQSQLPGIFDCVMCGVRATVGDRKNQQVVRYLITDEVRGWHGKVRDEKRRLASIEKTGNLIDLLARMDMNDEDFNEHIKTKEAA